MERVAAGPPRHAIGGESLTACRSVPQAVPSAGRNVRVCDESAFAADVLLSGIGSYAHAPKLIAPVERPHAERLDAHEECGRGAHEGGFGLQLSGDVGSAAGFAAWVARLLDQWEPAEAAAMGRCRAISVESSRAAECSAGSAIETEHWLT